MEAGPTAAGTESNGPGLRLVPPASRQPAPAINLEDMITATEGVFSELCRLGIDLDTAATGAEAVFLVLAEATL